MLMRFIGNCDIGQKVIWSRWPKLTWKGSQKVSIIPCSQWYQGWRTSTSYFCFHQRWILSGGLHYFCHIFWWFTSIFSMYLTGYLGIFCSFNPGKLVLSKSYWIHMFVCFSLTYQGVLKDVDWFLWITGLIANRTRNGLPFERDLFVISKITIISIVNVISAWTIRETWALLVISTHLAFIGCSRHCRHVGILQILRKVDLQILTTMTIVMLYLHVIVSAVCLCSNITCLCHGHLACWSGLSAMLAYKPSDS